MNTSPNIQRISGQVALGTALLLVVGLTCSIGALYLHGAAKSALSTIGKAAMIVGGGGLGISLPIYVLRKAPGDPGIYKRLIIAALIGVIAGITLLKVNISHPASKMVGQSLTTTSSSILMTLVFYWIIYGKEQEKTDRGHRLGGWRHCCSSPETLRLEALTRTTPKVEPPVQPPPSPSHQVGGMDWTALRAKRLAALEKEGDS